jgi:carbon-monoxide dehydrogenase iron sulfur subunit
MAKVLMIDYEKCTGCRLCELVCSVKHEGVSNPARSRITIVKWEMEGRYVPVVCVQCESPVCSMICPMKAVFREETSGRVKVDHDLCIGCKMCVVACPFGGIGFDSIGGKVIKCDLCQGDPQCVRFCETGALEFVDVEKLSTIKQRLAAERFSGIIRKIAASIAAQ